MNHIYFYHYYFQHRLPACLFINFCVFTGGGNLELRDVDRCDTDLSSACVPGEGHGYVDGCYWTCCLSLKGDRCTQGRCDLDSDSFYKETCVLLAIKQIQAYR